MKNIKLILTIIIAVLAMTYSNAQVKVVTSGDVKVGNTAVAPAAELHVDNATAGSAIRVGYAGSSDRYSEIADAGNVLAITKASPVSVNIDINPSPGASSNARFRYFRSTTTTGDVTFDVFKGDGTGTMNHRFAGNDNNFMGIQAGSNVVIGSASQINGGYKLQVAGSAFKNDGEGEWNIISDKKLKSNIKDYNVGLDLIQKINTVSYEYNGKAGTTKGQKAIGVLAQELQEIAPHMVNEITYTEQNLTEEGKEIVSETDVLTINTSSLKWALVNAIQEQQEIIDNQSDLIAELNDRLIALENRTDSESSTMFGVNGGTSSIKAVPNPFGNEATLQYAIDESVNEAVVVITDVNGRLIKKLVVSERGNGEINLNTSELIDGMYHCTLMIDGSLKQTEKVLKMK